MRTEKHRLSFSTFGAWKLNRSRTLEPSQDDRSRTQVEQYEATNGAQGGTLNGKPVIVLTFKAAKSGKIRKKPLMRIKHNGTYAVVASFDGGPKHPLWYRDIVANPIVELQDGAVKAELLAREVFRQRKGRMVDASGHHPRTAPKRDL